MVHGNQEPATEGQTGGTEGVSRAKRPDWVEQLECQRKGINITMKCTLTRLGVGPELSERIKEDVKRMQWTFFKGTRFVRFAQYVVLRALERREDSFILGDDDGTGNLSPCRERNVWRRCLNAVTDHSRQKTRIDGIFHDEYRTLLPKKPEERENDRGVPKEWEPVQGAGLGLHLETLCTQLMTNVSNRIATTVHKHIRQAMHLQLFVSRMADGIELHRGDARLALTVMTFLMRKRYRLCVLARGLPWDCGFQKKRS